MRTPYALRLRHGDTPPTIVHTFTSLSNHFVSGPTRTARKGQQKQRGAARLLRQPHAHGRQPQALSARDRGGPNGAQQRCVFTIAAQSGPLMEIALNQLRLNRDGAEPDTS